MILIGDKKEMIMLLQKARSKWYSLMCVGQKRHYRKNGTCKHTGAVLSRIKPESRYRIKINGYGGR